MPSPHSQLAWHIPPLPIVYVSYLTLALALALPVAIIPTPGVQLWSSFGLGSATTIRCFHRAGHSMGARLKIEGGRHVTCCMALAIHVLTQEHNQE